MLSGLVNSAACEYSPDRVQYGWSERNQFVYCIYQSILSRRKMTDEVLNLYKEVAAGGVGLIITWDGLHFLQFMHL
jgi:hypothetical protein